MTKTFAAVLLAVAALAARAEATPITVTNTIDWNDATSAKGTTYATFTTDAPPTWTHLLTFAPPAASFVSASVEISHNGNRSLDNEMWLLYDSGALLIGTLADDTGNSANTDFTVETFAIPVGLFPSFPATSWTLALRLADIGSQGDQEVYLDYSKLTATYNPVVNEELPLGDAPIANPEPASVVLLGTGLIGLAVRHYRSRRT